MPDAQVKEFLAEAPKAEVTAVLAQADGANSALRKMATMFWFAVLGALGSALQTVAPDFVHFVLGFVPDWMDGQVGTFSMTILLSLAAYFQAKAKTQTKTAVVDALVQPAPTTLGTGSFSKDKFYSK